MTLSNHDHLQRLEVAIHANDADHWVYIEAAQLALILGQTEKAAEYINRAIHDGYPYLKPIALSGETIHV